MEIMPWVRPPGMVYGSGSTRVAERGSVSEPT